MIENTKLEDINVYATDTSSLKEKPEESLYSFGVQVNWTAPAKWWNWLVNAITSAYHNFKHDYDDAYTEIKNTLGDADIIPTDGTVRQLSDAVDVISFNKVSDYDELPYVDGHKIILPITELLP